MTKRLKRLIDKAGTQADFCRRVWPRQSVKANKAKVNKWYQGNSGIGPEEAVTVAKAFDVRAAWLLLGELPEREGVTRTEAGLAADLAAYVASEGVTVAGANVAPWVRDAIVEMVGGADLLGVLVQLVREESEAIASWLHTRHRIGRAIKTLEHGRADEASEELKRVYASAPPPSGRVLRWQPVTFTRGALSPAKGKATKTKPTKRRK